MLHVWIWLGKAMMEREGCQLEWVGGVKELSGSRSHPRPPTPGPFHLWALRVVWCPIETTFLWFSQLPGLSHHGPLLFVLIQAIHVDWLSIYCVFGPVLGAKDTAMFKKQCSCPSGGPGLDESWGEKDNKKVDRYYTYHGMVKATKKNKTSEGDKDITKLRWWNPVPSFHGK